MRALPLAVVLVLVVPGLAVAQLGVPNPTTAPIMVRPGDPNAGKPGFAVDPRAPLFDPNQPASAQERPAVPFGFDPHPLNNPFPVLPNNFPSIYGEGIAIRTFVVPPREVTVLGYTPAPGSYSGSYEWQVVEEPAYLVTETTTGYVSSERLVLQQLGLGVYRWVRIGPTFLPK